jgi:hypothetical protein
MVAAILAGYQVTATGNWALPFYTAADDFCAGDHGRVSAQPLFLEQEQKLRLFDLNRPRVIEVNATVVLPPESH